MRIDSEALRRHVPAAIQDDDQCVYAVCIPLLLEEEGCDVLFEVRSGQIREQPGDVCFPGGRLEQGETPENGARRELCEELLLPPESVKLLGAGDILYTAGETVYSYAVCLTDYRNTFSRAEVSSVFRVPMTFFLQTEPVCYSLTWVPQPPEDFPYHLIQGGRNYRWRQQKRDEYFYQYDNHIIWGITAKIIRAYARIIKENEQISPY